MASDVAQATLCAEVVGPPGAGKSTLLHALEVAGAEVQPAAVHRSMKRFPLFLRSRLSLLPVFGDLRAATVSSRERIWMMRVEASLGVLERETSRGKPAVIFDQGPVYALLRLRTSSAYEARSELFRRWWNRKIDLWAQVLDLIVLLDAPDEVLMPRIRARSKDHPIKRLGEGQARVVLESDRHIYRELIEQIVGRGKTRVLEIDARRSPGEMAAATMGALGLRRE